MRGLRSPKKFPEICPICGEKLKWSYEGPGEGVRCVSSETHGERHFGAWNTDGVRDDDRLEFWKRGWGKENGKRMTIDEFERWIKAGSFQ